MHATGRRAFLSLTAAAAWAATARANPAPYPQKTIRLVVPYPPGGGNDVLARGLKTSWEKAWGQGVIVDNRPGGNGALGTEIVARAPGDGYTLLMGSIATHAMSPALNKGLRYDARKDFTPIAMVGSTPLILTVNPAVKARDLKEFIALAKAQPGAITYASVGQGSAGHLSGALFEQVAGVQMLHVPYKGISQASTELVGGQVQAAFSNVLNVLPLIRTGKLRALGVTGTQPLEILPGVPPIASVLPAYSVELWWGLFGPAGVPADIVQKLHAQSTQYLESADARAQWAKEGITLDAMSTAQFSARIAEDSRKWSGVIQSRNITSE